jgi:hypothetical protein
MNEEELTNLFALTESERTLDYLTILRDTSALGQKMQQDYEKLRAELIEEREKNKALEKELWDYRSTSATCINKRQFIWYFMAAKDRAPTETEWVRFINTFSFNYQKQLDKEVYDWIDSETK